MRPVWYLSRSVTGRGFVFPRELPDDFQTPGQFYIEAGPVGPDVKYAFRALNHGIPYDYVLRDLGLIAPRGRFAPRLFSAYVEGVGSFGFLAEPVDRGSRQTPMRYAGRTPGVLIETLWILIPQSSDALNRACRELDLFFVGVTDRDIVATEPELRLRAAPMPDRLPPIPG